MEVKSIGIFPVILLKLATPPLPPQTKLNLEKNGGNECFFRPQHCWGKWGDDGMNPKLNKIIVVRSRVLRNNYLEGLFHTVPSSFVLHCSINVMERMMEITTNTCRMMLMTGKTMVIWVTGKEMIGMAGMAGKSRIAMMTMITEMTGITGWSGITEMTGVTRMTGMSGVTRMTGMTGVTGMTRVTGLTWITYSCTCHYWTKLVDCGDRDN